MRYVGLDVHWKRSTICVLDEYGRRESGREVHGPWEKVLKVLGEIKRPFAICFEASTGYGYLYEKLKAMAERVVVAHPGKLRLIFRAKRKNDRVDAEKLAKLLYLDEVPTVYVPGADTRAWRAMVEYRSGQLAERTRAKNELRALLRSHGIRAPRGLWTRKGMAWLRALEFANSFDAMRRDMLVERIVSLNLMIKRVEAELGKVAAKHPGMTLLMSIPGVGIRTAEGVLAYVDDPQRFHRVNAMGAYFGMVPCQDASAGKNRLGHITREGPATVRRLVTEASWQAIRRSPTIKARFERIMQGKPERKKIALVAVAHYLLRVMLAMLKSGEFWRDSAA